MTTARGFTLIELMIVIAILGIVGSIIYPAITGDVGTRKDHKCIAGYAFTYSGNQIMSETGKGVPCAVESTTKIGQ
jgi:prepilin-type N-terminal cleavage/methylation domain-containing protein